MRARSVARCLLWRGRPGVLCVRARQAPGVRAARVWLCGRYAEMQPDGHGKTVGGPQGCMEPAWARLTSSRCASDPPRPSRAVPHRAARTYSPAVGAWRDTTETKGRPAEAPRLVKARRGRQARTVPTCRASSIVGFHDIVKLHGTPTTSQPWSSPRPRRVRGTGCYPLGTLCLGTARARSQARAMNAQAASGRQAVRSAYVALVSSRKRETCDDGGRCIRC
jgi:hypothetical protein